MTIYIPSTNYFNESRFIVDATAGEGRFTTIQAAINAATAGETVFIRPGTYTENITLKDGVNLTAFTRDVNIVQINGTITMNTAGTVNISGITVQTNGATAVSFSSANLQNLTFTNCTLTSTNANLITNSNSNASSLLTFTNCTLTTAATYKCIDASHTGQIRFNSCSLVGASTTASTSTSSGIITFFQGFTNQVFSLSGTTILYAWGLYVTTSNVTFLTVGTGAGARIYGGQIGTGSAVIFNITSTGYVEAYNVNLGSTNASTVTGTGTFYDGGCSYTATRNPATTTVSYPNTSGTLVLIETQSANNSASISFTKQLNATFNNYLILVSQYNPATNGTYLGITISTNGGATYLATNYQSGIQAVAYNSATWANATLTTYGLISGGVTSGTNNCFQVYMMNGTDGSTFKYTTYGSLSNGASTNVGQGWHNTTTINAIRFSSSSGNITTGIFSLYGVVK